MHPSGDFSYTFLDETAGQVAGALEAKELELQLLQSARLVSIGQMAAGVAHELNQPLTVISGAAEDLYLRLAEGLDLSPEQLRLKLRDVMEMSGRMEDTIEHLRVFSRDTSGEPGIPFSVNEAVRSSLKMIGAQLKNHGIALELDLAEGLPAVSGHPHQMEQVFLNLLANARDALDEREMEGRGDPGPSEAWRKQLRVQSRCARNGSRRVVIEVADNGSGMRPADQARVFEPFFTTKEAGRGTGLGLSISYAFVKNHGGEIACESRKGEGTVFRVTLPGAERQNSEFRIQNKGESAIFYVGLLKQEFDSENTGQKL